MALCKHTCSSRIWGIFHLQGNAEARFKMNGVKKIYLYCNRSGLFYLDVVKGIDDRRNGYDDTEERRQLESAAKILFG